MLKGGDLNLRIFQLLQELKGDFVRFINFFFLRNNIFSGLLKLNLQFSLLFDCESKVAPQRLVLSDQGVVLGLLLKSGSFVVSNHLFLLKSGSFVFLPVSFIIGDFFFLKIPDVLRLSKSP